MLLLSCRPTSPTNFRRLHQRHDDLYGVENDAFQHIKPEGAVKGPDSAVDGSARDTRTIQYYSKRTHAIIDTIEIPYQSTADQQARETRLKADETFAAVAIISKSTRATAIS